MFSMYDEALNRMRDTLTGRFVKFAHAYGPPDETCPNGCERFGEWWAAEDCAKHLGGAA